jgi:hypothetical protein
LPRIGEIWGGSVRKLYEVFGSHGVLSPEREAR